MTYPARALSIQQPWAWLIVNGFKDIENRTWRTNYRGPVLIHTGKLFDADARDDLDLGVHPVTRERLAEELVDRWQLEGFGAQLGGIVGVAEIVDCVSASASPWFVGDYGFVIRNARPLPFMPLKGALGFFAAGYRELAP